MTALHTQKGVWKKMLIIPSVKQLWGVMGDKKLNYTQARISFGLLEPRWDHFLYKKVREGIRNQKKRWGLWNTFSKERNLLWPTNTQS